MMAEERTRLYVGDEGMSATVIVPGVAVKDIHKNGIDIYATNCLLVAMRCPRLFFHPDFFTRKIHTKNISSFIRCTGYDIQPELYNLPQSKIGADYLRGPFVGKVRISSIGESSYVIEGLVYDGHTKKLLFRERSQGILVNLVTRRSQKFDKELPMYKIAAQYVENLNISSPFKWSKNDFVAYPNETKSLLTKRIIVTKDHIDRNGHMNILTYFKYAQQLVQQRNGMKSRTPALCQQLSALFEKEALLGDVLFFEAHFLKDAALIHIKRNEKVLSTLRYEGLYDNAHAHSRLSSRL